MILGFFLWASDFELEKPRISPLRYAPVEMTITRMFFKTPTRPSHVRWGERGAAVLFLWVCYCEGMFFEARAVANSTVVAGALISESGRLLP